MKRRNQNRNHGSASCSTNNPSFKRINESAASSYDRSEISKFFATTSSISGNSRSNKLNTDIGSPYRNIVTETSSNLNDSRDDDFKSPKYFKFRARNISGERKIRSRSRKSGKAKRNVIQGQKRLTNMLKENFTLSDVNPEHLQMALALSKSEEPIDIEEEDIESATCSPSKQTRILGVRCTLEQFGFKSNRAVSRNIELTKKLPRKSKYQFVTPILYIRTDEDRQNLISSKISMILSNSSNPQYNYEQSESKLSSSYLSKFVARDSRIFNLNKVCVNDLQPNHFYCNGMEIERNTAKCGHMLKDWSKIPGRDVTPPRETIPADSCMENKNDDIISINSESETEQRPISPDLFTSDDENAMRIRDNIDKTLELSLNIIDNLKNCSFSQMNPANLGVSDTDGIETDELDDLNTADDTIRFNESLKVEVTQNDGLGNTDDILGTLEISLSKDVESIQRKNNQIVACSASLLSNLDSMNRDDGIEVDSERCNASFSYDNISGIEHFEDFSDDELKLPENIEENQDKPEIKSESSQILDLTLSDDDSDKILYNGTIDKSGNSKQISNKFSGKYEILSDSSDVESSDDKCNSSEIKNLLQKTILNHVNLDSDTNKIDISTPNKSIRKSQSFASEISTKTPENLKKYASFTSPKQHQAAWNRIDEMFKTYSSSNSISSENLDVDDVVYISDEELNYSALCSKESVNLAPDKVEEDNLNSYSYLEKYNDEFYFAEIAPQTPIVHRRILELNKEATHIETQNSPQNNDHNHEDNTPGTPGGYVVIKTKNVTPLPDYDAMSSPRIEKELEKIGVKRLKRHRAVQILKYIYETTHPVCSKQQAEAVSPESDGDENTKVKRRKLAKYRRKTRVEVENGVVSEVCGDDEPDDEINKNERIEIVGDIQESEDFILERKQSKKIASCPLPLHIAWHNLVCSNPELKQNILLYEPLQLEVLFIMLKEQGYNYHIQDLLTFLDKKCITVQIKQTNRQRKRF